MDEKLINHEGVGNEGELEKISDIRKKKRKVSERIFVFYVGREM